MFRNAKVFDENGSIYCFVNGATSRSGKIIQKWDN